MVMTARPRTSCNPYSDWTMTSTNAPPTGPPSITTQPANKTVTATGTATFTVVATTPAGSGALTYQWYLGPEANTILSGEVNSTLTLASVTESMSGYQYTVRVANNYAGVVSNAATLTVPSNLPAAAPVITTSPANFTINLTGPPKLTDVANFSVDATGNPYPTFRWQEQIGGVWADTATNEDGLLGWNTKYLQLNSVALVNGRTFRAVATNASGSATSSSAVLTVVTVTPQTTHVVNCGTGVLSLFNPNAAGIDVVAAGNTKKFPTTASIVQNNLQGQTVGWNYSQVSACYDNNLATIGKISVGAMATAYPRAGDPVMTATFSGWSAYTFTVAPTMKVVVPSVIIPDGYSVEGSPRTPTVSVRLFTGGVEVSVATLTATTVLQTVTLTGVPTVSTTSTQLVVVLSSYCDRRSIPTTVETISTVNISEIYLEG